MAYFSFDHYGPIVEKKMDKGEIVRVEMEEDKRLSVFDRDGNRYVVKPSYPRFEELQKIETSD